MSVNSSTYHRLTKLETFLRKKDLGMDADRVLDLKVSASPVDTVVIDRSLHLTDPLPGDETASISERLQEKTRRFYSDYILDRNGLVSKQYIGGKESVRRGVGKASKEGDIHRVKYNGGEAIAKVLRGHSEAAVWDKIYSLDMPRSISRHVPIIYDIIKDGGYSIIIMEELEPLSLHIKDSLTSSRGRDSDSLAKNDEYVYEAIRMSISSLCSSDCPDSIRQELYDNADYYINEISGGIFDESLNFKDSYDYLFDIISKSNTVRYGGLSEEDKQSLARLLSSAIKRAFTVSKRPIPKYYSPDRLNKMREYGSGFERKRIDRDMQSVYTENPISFLFSEKHMPETKSLFGALKFFKENGIVWDDVHTNNLMQRPSTKDVVLIDVGLYSIK